MAMYWAVFLALAFNGIDVEERFYISFERSGGFTGIVNSTAINGDTISIEEKNKLRELIEDAGFFALKSEELEASHAADGFTYYITIEIGDEKNSLHVNDPAIPDSLRPLISYLSKKARVQK